MMNLEEEIELLFDFTAGRLLRDGGLRSRLVPKVGSCQPCSLKRSLLMHVLQTGLALSVWQEKTP